MKYIDLETWQRKAHFAFFSRMDYPQYNISANLDVTRYLKTLKEKALPFYYGMIHASTLIAQGIPEFCCRIREDGVIQHEKLRPSYTEMTGDGLFKLVTLDLCDDISAFCARAKEKSQSQTDYFPFEEISGDDLLYITCIPWVSFTHLSHTITLNRKDSVPRLSWGKYFNQDGRILMPYSVQVNHALVDGIHIGQFFSSLQSWMDA